MAVIVFLRGGGDLASGVALRLHRAGLPVLVTELPQPMVVRRRVAFAEAVYQGEVVIEGVRGRRVQSLEQAVACTGQGMVAVQVDPEAAGLEGLKARFTAVILVDARMTKRPPETGMEVASLVIGLGPGFTAGQNCHAVVETNRGHAMGRVIWQGSAEKDTGVPERVDRWTSERVLRAPRDGVLHTLAEIGEQVLAGQVLAEVGGAAVRAPFNGALRGLLHGGMAVTAGMKIGDLDPRNESRYADQVSDKALAVGGGVLEAILSRPELRCHLWDCAGRPDGNR